MIETAMEERHAHEVMEMMLASGKSYNRASLAAEIRARFGAKTTFYACSAKGMTAEQLVDFLAMKGKFTGTENNFVFDPGRMCTGH